MINRATPPSMTSLIVAREFPWPDNGGGRMRNLRNIAILSTYGKVIVLVVHDSWRPPPPRHLIRNIHSWLSLDQLILEDPPPYASCPAPLKLEWWNNYLGHPFDAIWSPFRHVALSRYIARQKINFILFEDICLWRYVSATKLQVPILMDCHNSQSHLDRELARALSSRSSAFQERVLRAANNMETVHRELPVSGFLVCSGLDQDRLQELGIEKSRIDVVHNVVKPLSPRSSVDAKRRPMVSELLSACRGPFILFAGVMNYAPNVSSALFLIQHVLPLVKQCIPDARLLIVGKWPTPELLEASLTNPHVFITGEVLDTLPYYDLADVLCVPLQSGGGTRFKILEAFAADLPVVSSAKGCEGLTVKNGRELLIAETAHENADAIVRILSNKELKRSLCSSAKILLGSSYTPAVAAKQMRSVLRKYGLIA